MWYLGDGLIFAELSVLGKILERLASELPRIGLDINKAKTIVAHSGSLETFSSLKGVNSLDLRSTGSGVKVLGVPIDDNAFIENDLDSILAKVQIYCDKICMLGHPQAAL